MSAKIITFVAQNLVVMKRISLIISFVVVVAMSGYAQTRIGLKFGPTFNWASSGSIAAKNDGLGLGFRTGLVVDYHLTENIAVSSGANLNLIRMKYTFTDHRYVDDFLEKTDVHVARRLKAINVEVPLKIKVKFDIVDSFKAFVEAGGGMSFNVRDIGKDHYTFYWVSSERYNDCTNQYRLFQASMVFGVGAEYEINRNLSAFVQLTFDHAFTNTFVKTLEQQTGSILRNNFIGLEVGVMH
jgi:hypothetical protein